MKQAASQAFKVPNIRRFIAFKIFFNSRFYYPVFTVLFLDYGLTVEQFAILNSIWAVTIVCTEVPSGALADIIGRKNLLVATSLLMVLELGVIAFVPLGNMNLVFWAFFINRILSGLAEAMASGADEAIAYDSLAAKGLEHYWPAVLSLQMRLAAIAFMFTATIGAAFYDPDVVNRVLAFMGSDVVISQQQSMRYPIYFTLVLAGCAVFTAFRFREDAAQGADGKSVPQSSIFEAFRLTMRAGKWILVTPLALAVIVCGMFFDHILRMLITLESQYFRQIGLPEASFGIISAVLSLLGLFVPKVCEHMVHKYCITTNLFILMGGMLATLFLLAGFFPYIGILPVAGILAGLMMVSFFTSHYLNLLASSEQRATVLSFKGMAFNLAYGALGVFFAMLLQYIRTGTQESHSEWSKQLVENSSFMTAIGCFPWYAMLFFVIIVLYFRKKLRHDAMYRQLCENPSFQGEDPDA